MEKTYRVSVALLATVLQFGCAQLESMPGSGLVQAVTGEIKLAFHQRGETKLSSAEELTRSGNCAGTGALQIVSHEILPSKLKAGREVGMSWVYVMCAPSESAERTVRVTYQVLMNGNSVWSDTPRKFDVNAGKWRVNNMVTIPKQATPGRYEWVVRVEGSGVFARSAASFQVEQ